MLTVYNEAVHVFKPLLWDNAVKFSIAKLFKLIPLLGIGPMGVVVAWLVVRLTDILFEVLDEQGGVELIPKRNQKLRLRYDNASIGLGQLASAHGVDSKEFQEAREREVKAFDDLVRFGIK